MPANPLGVALRSRRAGHHTLVWARPGLQAPDNFTLTSPRLRPRGADPAKAPRQAARLGRTPADKGHAMGRARLDGAYEIR